MLWSCVGDRLVQPTKKDANSSPESPAIENALRGLTLLAVTCDGVLEDVRKRSVIVSGDM